ncbi:hypothetical protein JHK82_028718 [Glycine max]|nr:hypothetical protein JHK86_028839 [Glycine max]KAG5127883.1 hypothetical protein JHK82_028718 [Glycine max]KAG5152493.1 hypothetical protein JHK84_028965 [Glycine max]
MFQIKSKGRSFATFSEEPIRGRSCPNDLEQLENQLEAALRNIRSTKTQFMLDQLSDLHHRVDVCFFFLRTF